MQQVRVIKPTRRSVSGLYSYDGLSIPYESTLERDFVIFQTFKSNVLEVVAQPVTIPFKKNGRTYNYTPDYFVHLDDGAEYRQDEPPRDCRRLNAPREYDNENTKLYP